MALLRCSSVVLRVMGDPLVLADITAVLGTEPSWSQRKGDQIPNSSGDRFHTVLLDVWAIDTPDRKPENLDAQVQEILTRLPSDLNIWADLGSKYKLNLFCGLFMKRRNEGFLISPQTLISLGQRGIELDCDLYAP